MASNYKHKETYSVTTQYCTTISCHVTVIIILKIAYFVYKITENEFENKEKFADTQMGLLSSKLTSLWESISNLGGTQARILMLGLDAAGKTSILYKFKLNEQVTTIPTIGFNVETVTPLRNVSFTVWDIGGQATIRQLWRYYYQGTDGLIFIVDSTDRDRFVTAREELHAILDDADMAGVPVIVFANKQDLPRAVEPSKLVQELGLNTLRGHDWYIQATSACSGLGLYEGMEQLVKLIKDNRKRN